MDALVVTDSDAQNIFYRDRKFDNYCQNNIRFVTRLKSNAIMDVIQEHTVQPSSNILREANVLLGDQKMYLMESPLRLIECLWPFILIGFITISGYFMFRMFLKVLPKADGKSTMDWQNH